MVFKKSAHIFVMLLLLLSLLVACGRHSESTVIDRSAGGPAESSKKTAPAIHDQIRTIVREEKVWHREDNRLAETADDPVVEGPLYSLMDLDQNGYVEIVVSGEEKQNGPFIYEVTEDGKLQKWTADGDLPGKDSFLEIFEGTNKADCYYDPSRGQYHYIVWDKLFVSQDDADVTWLDMVPGNSGVTFKKIGRHTFDAAKDNKFHYFNADGEECKKSDITKDYSGMQKKTMYFSKVPISKKEAGEKWGWDLEHAVWKSFIFRDVYRSDREKGLTDKFLWQFTSLSISMDGYAESLGEVGSEDEVRYAAVDLDNDRMVEVIIENRKTKKWCIYEYNEHGDSDRQWKTKNKKITDYTDKIPEKSWYAYNVYHTGSKMINPGYDQISDNLRESWLRFADYNKLP